MALFSKRPRTLLLDSLLDSLLVSLRIASIITFSIVALSGCNYEGDNPLLGPAPDVLHGQIIDELGNPVEGAMVTADGISAEELTDAEGRFTVVSPHNFEQKVSITADKPGFHAGETFIDTTDEIVYRKGKNGKKKGGKKTPPVPIPKKEEPKVLQISTPAEGAQISVNECCEGSVDVSGLVSFPERPNFRLDVVFALDVSGSITKKDIFADEIGSVRSLLTQLDSQTTRIGLLSFASNDNILQELTNDFSEFESSLKALEEEGALPYGDDGSATHYADAMRAANKIFDNKPLTFIDSSTNEEVTVEPMKVVVFISDGIPTLPASSGLTQEKADVNASLAAARLLKAQNIILHAVAFAVEENEIALTTLPAVAAITGGDYYEVPNSADALIVIPEASLVGMGTVVIENTSTGENVTTQASPDGFFAGNIAITSGTQLLQVTAYDIDGSVTSTQTVSVEGTYVFSSEEPYGLATKTVAEGHLKTPTGKDLGDDDLKNLFTGEKNNYPDAAEAIGAEVFIVNGTPEDTIDIKGEFVFKEACYASDIGYLIVNSADPVASTQKAFKEAKAKNVLFNAGSDCGSQYFTPGKKSFEFNAPAQSSIAFFLVPNNTLASAQSGDNEVFFTVTALNPGGFDQSLTFYSPKGRLDSGEPHTIFSFEDQSMSLDPDKDFDDIVFAVDTILPSRTGCVCNE